MKSKAYLILTKGREDYKSLSFRKVVGPAGLEPATKAL